MNTGVCYTIFVVKDVKEFSLESRKNTLNNCIQRCALIIDSEPCGNGFPAVSSPSHFLCIWLLVHDNNLLPHNKKQSRIVYIRSMLRESS
jgi:hypothetical protein